MSGASDVTFSNINEIMKYLPHRFPFLLIDRVEEIHRPPGPSRVGRRIRAIKNVSVNEPYFPGHFPHRPIMPGVLQLEVMAQAAALACVNPDGPRTEFAIAGCDQARFRSPVVPGDTLEVTAEVLKDRASILVIRCEVRVKGAVVSESQIMAAVLPIPAQ